MTFRGATMTRFENGRIVDEFAVVEKLGWDIGIFD